MVVWETSFGSCCRMWTRRRSQKQLRNLVLIAVISLLLLRIICIVDFHSSLPTQNEKNLDTDLPSVWLLDSDHNYVTTLERITTTDEKSVVLCAVVKEEDRYIDEWVDYHFAIGFTAIYIYDNSPNYTLQSWRPSVQKRRRIKLSHFPGEKRQLAAYDQCASYAQKDGFYWGAFYDVDEFLVLRKHNNVVDFLTDHCLNGSVIVNWRVFGTSNQTVYEPIPVTKRFQYMDPTNGRNRHYKAITRLSEFLTYDWSPHFPTLKEGYDMFDTNGNYVFDSLHENGPRDVAVLHHYMFKSKQEYIEKRMRGRADYNCTNDPDDCMRLLNEAKEDDLPIGSQFDDFAWTILRERVPKYRQFDGWKMNSSHFDLKPQSTVDHNTKDPLRQELPASNQDPVLHAGPNQREQDTAHRHVVFIMVGSVRTLEKTYTTILENLLVPLCPPSHCTSYLVTHLSDTDNRPDVDSNDPIGKVVHTLDSDHSVQNELQRKVHQWLCSTSSSPPSAAEEKKTSDTEQTVKFQSCHLALPSYNIGSVEEQNAMDTYEYERSLKHTIISTPGHTQRNSSIIVNRIRSLRYGDPRRYSMWFARHWAWRYVEKTFLDPDLSASTTPRYEFMFLRPDMVWYLPFATIQYIRIHTSGNNQENTASQEYALVHDSYYGDVPDTFAYLPNVPSAQKYFSLASLVENGVACLGGPQFNQTLSKLRLIEKNIFVPSRDRDIIAGSEESLSPDNLSPSWVVEWCADQWAGWSENILWLKLIKVGLAVKYIPAGAIILRSDQIDCVSVSDGFFIKAGQHPYSYVPWFACKMLFYALYEYQDKRNVIDIVRSIRPYRIRGTVDNTICLTLLSTDDESRYATVAPQACHKNPEVHSNQTFSSSPSVSDDFLFVSSRVTWNDEGIYKVRSDYSLVDSTNYRPDTNSTNSTVWMKEYVCLY